MLEKALAGNICSTDLLNIIEQALEITHDLK